MADGREQPVVVAGVDRGRTRAEGDEQLVQPVVEHAGRVLTRGQVPGGGLEEVRACVLHPSRLRAGDRVAADEALVGDRRDNRALRRADVGDQAIGGRRLEGLGHELRQRADRCAGEARPRAFQGAGHRVRHRVDRPAPAGGIEDARVRIEPDHLGPHVLPGGEPDRAADQADAEERYPHLARTRPC